MRVLCPAGWEEMQSPVMQRDAVLLPWNFDPRVETPPVDFLDLTPNDGYPPLPGRACER